LSIVFIFIIFRLLFTKTRSNLFSMANTKVTTVALTTTDRQLIKELQKRFEPEHGKQSVTGVIRIALRKAAQV
jgi:hypothetical protein